MLSFGCHLYDTRSVIKDSKSFLGKLNRTSYENYFLSWRRLILPNVLYWKHSTKWPTEKRTDAEDEEDYSLVNISDTENEAEKNKRLNIRKRNKRFRRKKKDESMEILSIKQPLINEKTLETLWKLYRNIGESIEDIKQRLVDMPSDEAEFSICNDNNYSVANMTVDIKDEILPDDERFCSENESDETEEGGSERESTKVKDLIHLKNIPTNKIKSEKSESTDCDSVFDHPLSPSEMLTVEIQETSNTIQFSCDHEVAHIKEECTKDSTFKVPTLSASESLVEPIPNCKYRVPRLRQITNAELVVENKIITRASRRKNAAVKTEVKDEIPSNNDKSTVIDFRVKSTTVKLKLKRKISSCEEDEPIIKEMHGVITRSYNTRASKVKIPKCFKVTKLSDDEEVECFDSSYGNSEISVSREKSHCSAFNRSDDILSSLRVNLSSDSDKSDLAYKRKSKQRKLSTAKAEYLEKPRKSKSSGTSSSSSGITKSSSTSSPTSSSHTCTHSSCSHHSYRTRSSCSCSSSSPSSTISNDNNK